MVDILDLVDINDGYRGLMTKTAKIFMHGRSQAVRLPKEFRLPGKEARVSKVGNKVILEPMEEKPFDAQAFWAEIDVLGGRDFPEIRDDDLRPELDDGVSFD
jgi:antitoxin VapB